MEIWSFRLYVMGAAIDNVLLEFGPAPMTTINCNIIAASAQDLHALAVTM